MNNEDQGSPKEPETHGESGSSASFIPLSALRLNSEPPMDLSAVREKLSKARGPEYWRSLDELADTPEFQRVLAKEFPQVPNEMEPLGRRAFLKVMGATLALAGVAGCGYQPAEKIVPYVKQPEVLVPGKALYFATAFTQGGYAIGTLAESQMGRPVKLEGNPNHPASLGSTNVFLQGSLLDLYDPDRSQSVRNFADPSTFDAFAGQMTTEVRNFKAKGGAGLRILTETITSPTLSSQITALLAMYPGALWHQYEPVSRSSIHAGAKAAFGSEVNPVYRFDLADKIVSLDSDFMIEEPGSVRYARDFSDRRRVRKDKLAMNRLYSVESSPTLTGAMADHRYPVQARQIENVARALAEAMAVGGVTGASAPEGLPANFIPELVKDLQASPGASIVLAGPHQPPVVHAICHAINKALGNLGKTVLFTDPVEARPEDQMASLASLVSDMQAGKVDTLVILGGNPVYAAPADLPFAEALKKVRLTVHNGSYNDETGIQCQWHVPQSHYLESWSDARAYDGTVSIVQPLIQPLYESRSAHEMLAVLLGQGTRNGLDIVQEYWRGVVGGAGFEKFWTKVLNDGVIANTALPNVAPALLSTFDTGPSPSLGSPGGMEIIFKPDPTIWDGRYANNGWLQELPKPFSKLTWDNAATMSAATAKSLGFGGTEFKDDVGIPRSDGQLVELTLNGRKLQVPLWIMPGHPDNSVTLTLGYGRKNPGKVGEGTGFNANLLRTSESPGVAGGLDVKMADGSYFLASTQQHFNMKGRELVRNGTLAQYRQRPEEPSFMAGDFKHENPGANPSLFPRAWPSTRKGLDKNGVPEYSGEGYNGEPIPAWGMVIDSNTCIGCNACTIACQAENNIATVGKKMVANTREMHWIRIDTYYMGENTANPPAFHQPVPCMHCENAPCELVCPVEATTHSAEGINEQVYNRCIGTRYCENNCPYKVRRFNYLQFSDQKTPTLQMMRNPDVTVRSRGVMEKCTYCIQRINEARIQAEKEERPIRDGDVVTACAQVCPTRAIVFGNINDTFSNKGQGSRVRQLKAEPLNYGLLAEVNTLPRTTYLARLYNPNPALPSYYQPESDTTEGAG